jgi:hypothetical protein
MPVEDLRQSPMMAHMLDALDNGEDIGHYGRLVFAMIGRHFVSNDELVELLTKDHDADEQEIRAMVQQVEDKGYSPPRREKILEFQHQQDFQICPNPDDPDACNVYNELQFPDDVYESIQQYPGVETNLVGLKRSAEVLTSADRAFQQGSDASSNASNATVRSATRDP